MADADLQVTFSADTSDLKSAVADASAAIRSIRADVDATSKAFDTLKKAVDKAYSTGPLAAFGAANQDAAAKFHKSWNGVVNPLVSSFTKGLMNMAEGTKSFAQVMRGLGQQILNEFINKVINPMIEKWLWKEVGQSAATTMGVQTRTATEQAGAIQSRAVSFETAQKDTLNSAVKAAGGAFSAMAGIPIVGPVLGAAAASAAFTAVEAFGQLASAAGGFDIPAGVNPITQLHAQEMVLPARLANPMRAMLSAHAANPHAPSVAQAQKTNPQGDTHLHVHAMDAASVQRLFMNNGAAIASAIRAQHRAGAFAGL